MNLLAPWANEIKAVGFDLDQTLYPDTPQIQALVRQEIYRLIAGAKNITESEAKNLFEFEYKKLGRGTLAVQNILNISDANDIMQACLEKAGVDKLLKHDTQLVELIKEIKSSKKTFLITGSSRKNSISKLDKLGLKLDIFDYVLCIDDPNSDKLYGNPFQQIIAKTGFNPKEHVYVGDREKIDITPAKNAGMKAIYVWGECMNADASIPTIYDLKNILGLR